MSPGPGRLLEDVDRSNSVSVTGEVAHLAPGSTAHMVGCVLQAQERSLWTRTRSELVSDRLSTVSMKRALFSWDRGEERSDVVLAWVVLRFPLPMHPVDRLVP